MAQMRLDHFLAEEGVGSRTEVKKMIRAGRVRLNGEPVRKAEQKTDPEKDCVELDGKRVGYTGFIYLMMNKPAGVLSATKDGRTPTVINLVSEPWAGKLFPAGRLDKDTEGFILLTNDGDLSHRLLSPRKHVSKTYFAVVTGSITDEDIRLFWEGLDIGEKKKTLPAKLMRLSADEDLTEKKKTLPEKPTRLSEDGELTNKQKTAEEKLSSENAGLPMMEEHCLKSISMDDYARCGDGECCAAISITEGKFHQIKRMFEAVGKEVHFLKRIAMGGVCLDGKLESGQYRKLTEEELKLLTDDRNKAGEDEIQPE